MSTLPHAEESPLVDPRPRTSSLPDRAQRRNRLALVGTVVYLLEWVAIIGASVDVPVAPTDSPDAILGHYQGHADALAFAAGWFALVLVGRVVFAAALVSTLSRTDTPRWLTTTAVAAMTTSVGLEVATYGITAGAARGATTGAVLVGLNDVAWVLDQLVMPLLGVSVLCLVAATARSGLFGRWVHVPGLLGGVMMTGSALLLSPRLSQAYDVAGNSGVPFFWIWMIWIAVLCWCGPRTRS